MGKILGIDLGTTNSCVAVMEGGQPTVIHTTLGSRMTKSVVRFLPTGEPIVGEHAYRTRLVDPRNTITGIKRFIGRRYNEVFDIARTVPFKVMVGNNNLAVVEAHGKEYSPQHISAMILKSLKSSAEDYLGQPADKAVITVPAYFHDRQREATREAGQMAGLEVLRIINEPNAAALAYGLDKKEEEAVAVFDLGGGTFDISVLFVADGVVEVLAVSGDNFLGGDDFDNRVVGWVVEEFGLDSGIDLTRDPFAMQLVREAAVTAKCELSAVPQTSIEIPFLPYEGGSLEGLSMTLTREKFEELCAELFERLTLTCRAAVLKAGRIYGRDIEKVILVGGATRMPRIQELVKEVFRVEPSRSVNPDEAVALGAAVQGGVLSGEKTDILLLDIVAKSLGVETEGGMMLAMIPENTTNPTRKSEIFSTSLNNQTSVEIHVLEGEAALAVDNRSLGRFVLDGIAPALGGEPQIEVTFDIDANHTIIVSARDLATGRERRLTVKATTGLSEYERARRITDVREM
jgi:molecular chaperone DnaK